MPRQIPQREAPQYKIYPLFVSIVIAGCTGPQTRTAPASSITPSLVELKEVVFMVDKPGRTEHGAVFYTANGNNISFVVYPVSDPAWSSKNTPEGILSNSPPTKAAAGETIVDKRLMYSRRKDGYWLVKHEHKVVGSQLKDAPQASVSWHINRYVFTSEKIIVMRGCWFKNGDIEEDYRTFDLITDTIVPK